MKHAAAAFVIAVVFYIVFWQWVEHRRSFRGPWTITFQTDRAGQPSLAIAEPKLKISQAIIFHRQKIAQTNLSTTIRFDDAVTNLPFGKMEFQDPTFLPGTVTMKLFDHEIELLPRVLVIDKKEVPWRSATNIDLP